VLDTIRKFLAFKAPAIFHRIAPKNVKYEGFAHEDDEAFASFVDKRLDHPAKRQALDWLTRDPILNEKFSLLDVGCGPGVLARMILDNPNLRDRMTYVGVDQSENAIRYCRKTLPQDYKLICQDVLVDGLPRDNFDVIMMNEVLEHIPHYDQLISTTISKQPKIVVLTTFAVLPERDRDRILWRPDLKCYMNSYSFKKFFAYLRNKFECPITIRDYGSVNFNRYWFPSKALMIWYIKLGAEKTS
jgi:SAM-dependent methyltransferase